MRNPWVSLSCLALLACGSPASETTTENPSEPSQGGASETTTAEAESAAGGGGADSLTACSSNADCVVIGRDCCNCRPGWIAVRRGAEPQLYRQVCGEMPICSPCQPHETPARIHASCHAEGRCVLQPGTESEAVPLLRLELLHPTMRAGSDPDTDDTARLDARLLVRNASAAPITVSTTTYAAFQLRWSILAEENADGYEPTFLPPPMPPPGGIPPRTVTVPPGAEVVLAELFGVSGYRRSGAPADEWLRVLPPGRYRVAVRDVTLAGLGAVASGPATLVVEP